MLSLNNCRMKNCVNVSASEAPLLTVHWLENEAVAGFRVWQIIFMCFAGVLTLVIFLCCCIRFRIPRTKQEIEADFIRKKITKKFQKQLRTIQNSDMDEMDLKRALDRVRAEFKSDTESLAQSDALSEATLNSANFNRPGNSSPSKNNTSIPKQKNDLGLSLRDIIKKERQPKRRFSTLAAIFTRFRSTSRPHEVLE